MTMLMVGMYTEASKQSFLLLEFHHFFIFIFKLNLFVND